MNMVKANKALERFRQHSKSHLIQDAITYRRSARFD